MSLCLFSSGVAAVAHGQTGGDFSVYRSADPTLEAPHPAFERVPIFFPPNPPPLGRALAPASATNGRFAAPPELALYVNDIFYPALGSRLQRGELPAKLRTALDQHRAKKTALQAELRAELERVRPLAQDKRVPELAAFARKQTPAIVELEKTAEELRRELIVSDYTWSAWREWHLDEKPRQGFSPTEISQVMRSYAFYVNGLLPGQRRLLREISLEIQMAEESADKAAAAQPYLFFPPEPARVTMPDDAPASAAAKFAAYQTKKSQLKKELYDTVYKFDGERFAFFSGRLSKLAEKQAPVLAELDRLAEEIRVGLGDTAEPTSFTEKSPLPPVLQERIASLMVQLKKAQAEATQKLEAILARTPEVQGRYRFDADGIHYVVIPPGDFPRRGRIALRSQADPEKLATARAEFAAVAEAYGRDLATFVNEKDAIVTEVRQTLGTAKPEQVNVAFNAAVRVALARETDGAYRDYRTAVFQPGLSPEQRRLLFDWVVEALALPLPRGELQPTIRNSQW